jgi:ADP-ribose pyrophosphatase
MPPVEKTLLETKRFRVVEQVVEKPDGATASLSFIRHPGSVAVLPLVDQNRICLIRNRRLTVDKTLLEIPAGTREPNESPLETARRELIEETGYRAEQFDELTVFYPSPGITDERMWLYVATGLTLGDHAREPNEEIENLVVTWSEALAMLDRGEIEDGKTSLALLLYNRKQS